MNLVNNTKDIVIVLWTYLTQRRC